MIGSKDRFRNRIEEFLDGELSTAEEREFAAHLEDCPGCRGSIEAARRIRRLALDALPVPIPEELGTLIRRRIVGAGPGRRTGRRSRLLRLSRIAAAAAAGVLLAVWIFSTADPPGPEEGLLTATIDRPTPPAVTDLEDWLDQAGNSAPEDTGLLVDEARSLDLLSRVRVRLVTVRGEERRFLLSVEDLLIQLTNDPSPGELLAEARLIAMARPR